MVVREGLAVGQELATDQIEALAKADNVQRCLNAATHYLSYRPRSEFELRERLHRRGFDGDRVGAVLARLKGQGLVDDVEFAQFWQEIIGRGVSAVSDEDSAYRAALSKARRLPVSDCQSFRRRLGKYLRRRGFSYGVINNTVEQLWQEMREQL